MWLSCHGLGKKTLLHIPLLFFRKCVDLQPEFYQPSAVFVIIIDPKPRQHHAERSLKCIPILRPQCMNVHNHIISYHIISYHIISYHIISYHIISYHIISYQLYSVSPPSPKSQATILPSKGYQLSQYSQRHVAQMTQTLHLLGGYAKWLGVVPVS